MEPTVFQIRTKTETEPNQCSFQNETELEKFIPHIPIKRIL